VVKPKVLLVNDHPPSLLALESVLLRKQGESDFEVVTAQSGEEALRHVLQQQFAVILLRRSFIPIRGQRQCPSFSLPPTTLMKCIA
jgi:CheY-like chemotaxis protein